MVTKAPLSSKTHPEPGQAAAPVPISDSGYDHTIDLLTGLGVGTPTTRDHVTCHGSLILEALMGPPREPSQRRVAWGEEPQRNERALSYG